MNKWLLLLLTACSGGPRTEAPFSTPAPPYTERTCLTAQEVRWQASEMRGARTHQGTVALDTACLHRAQHRLVGGYFSADLQRLDVLDIPAHEVSAKANLLRHLKSPDFLHVSAYPRARLTLLEVRPVRTGVLALKANLQIREVTRGIRFEALEKDGKLSATLNLPRADWNINFQGSWWKKTLIDPIIVLEWEINSATVLH